MRILLRHTGIYLLARGVPGLVNFLAIAVYTRLLSPEEYGRYALVIAGAGFANVVLFQWLALALLRYVPGHDTPLYLMATAKAIYRWLVLATAIGGLLLIPWVPQSWQLLFAGGLVLLWAQAWFEINLQVLRAKLAPVAFGIASGLKAVLAIVTGVSLLKWYPVALAPIVGHIVGFLLGSAVPWRSLWQGVRVRDDRRIAVQIMQYGVPLSATLALSYLLNSSDRFLIAYFIGDHAAGVYAAGYDLASQILLVLMVIINTAAFPLILNDLEQRGIEPARQQLSRNIFLLLAVATPFTAGMVLFAPEVARTVLGQRFQETATSLIPWIAIASLFNGLRSYHFDLAFQVGKSTVHQLWVMGVAILVNVALNLIWIPHYGVMGAAWSTLAAYAAALLASVVVGRRFFPLPVNWRGMVRVGLAVLAMLGVWLSLPYSFLVTSQLLLAAVSLLAYSGVLAVTTFVYPNILFYPLRQLFDVGKKGEGHD
ncbi:MAG: oligosaccharide flippase family protein [Armatimonadota bacterium]